MRTPAATVASLLLAGCTTAGYHATKVEPLPEGLKGHVSGTGAAFEIDKLRVAFYNGDVARQGEAIPPLMVGLRFQPREVGYSFDPDQVRLRGADGAEWRPRVVKGLTDTRGGPCNPALSAQGDQETSYTFLSARSCFDFQFDVRVPPDVPFELVLDGFARGPSKLPAVTLRIQRRSWRSIEHIWPLEILLLPLMVAP